ncbi:7-cyano-7-deazaguanine synthase QueC [Candidatus Bathyarchaeota archaeon]|nr:7-cyano-7-deazaguanine synthase QueC [Candidatus Bathyarchaeota archaeon]
MKKDSNGGRALEKENKCIVVLSGGLDSTTVAYWAKNQGYSLYLLTFKYGQIATKEVKYALKIANKLKAPIRLIDLSSLKKIFTGVSSLCDADIPMTSKFSQPIIVPFRNAILLSIAVAYAVSINAARIFYGAQGSDEPFYPDCRREFYKSFEATARLGTDLVITIEAPFSNMPKSEIIKLGSSFGVPFDLTWSCYLNGPKHCGKCESCVNRKNAFAEAGILDPTEYNE